MADKKNKPLYDARGNLIAAARKRAKAVQLRLTTVAKQNATDIVVGGVAGAVSVGLGLGLISKVKFLRDMVTVPGAKRVATVTGVSLGVAGLGLYVASKVTSPRKVMDVAPFVLGGTAILALGPTLASNIVEKIEKVVGGFVSGNSGATPQLPPATTQPVPATAGAGPVPRMRSRPRRALVPDEVIPPRATYGTYARW